MTLAFRSLGLVLAVSFVASACTTSSPEASADVAGTTTAPTELVSTIAACDPTPGRLQLDSAPATTPAALVALSVAVFDCVDSAVLVGDSDVDAVRVAAETAVAQGGPLLSVRALRDVEVVVTELARLRVETVTAIGLRDTLQARTAEALRELDITLLDATPPPVATSFPTTTVPSTAEPPDPTSVSENTQVTTAIAAPDGGGLPSGESTVDDTTTSSGIDDVAPELLLFDSLDTATTPDGPLVLFGPGDLAAAYLSLPSIVAGGGTVVVGDFGDTDALAELVDGRSTVLLGGDSTPTQRWQVALATSDRRLFGGGTRMFPDRRIVAYYGNPLTFRLGLLGETDAARAVERVAERARLYEADGLPPVQPGFEIIATVASVSAGDDGDYSNETDVEVLRPWIEAAVENDVSVILDLQPGRTDFVTQAKIYEEYLRLPNVGLALDPEWRLGPDQRHLRQIGRVTAEEVNAVVDYLVELVHEETLPQKILILHQFQTRMLPDRELIETPPELAVVVHVDGQGSLGSKYGTWAAMLDFPSPSDQTLWWGWKNFIDEDFPTATPGQVNAVVPLPVIVTYQ